MSYAQDERHAVADLLAELGPEQPTLCAGWRTADLAAHLVLRERRPDVALGVLGGPLAGHTRRAMARFLRQTPFPLIVELIRSGPPRMSVFGLPGADERGNAVEYFVHHEDIRRAQPGWEPRKLPDSQSDHLWRQLRLSRLMLRSAPVGVEFARADAAASPHPDASRHPDADPRTGADPHTGAGLNTGTSTNAGTGPHADAGLTTSAGAGPDAGLNPGAGRAARGADGGPLRITAKARAPMVTVMGPPAELTLWAFGRAAVARVRMAGSDPDVAALASDRWRS